MTVKVKILSVERAINKLYLCVTYEWGDPPTPDWVLALNKEDVWRAIERRVVEYRGADCKLQEAQSLVGQVKEL